MSQQDNIYNVLLELKEATGKTNASIDDIKINLAKHIVEVEKLKEKHEKLEKSHNSIKGKVLWISGLIGSAFGATFAYLKLEWEKLFN